MHNISIVAGSFDPIQKGHIWLIKQAAIISNRVIIAIGTNPAKKYLFTTQERTTMIWDVLSTAEFSADEYSRIDVDIVGNELLAAYASRTHASLLVRGIRNMIDFQYEHEVMSMNRIINSSLETVFFVPPDNLCQTSSSTVKGLMGFPGWQSLLSGFATPNVITALEQKLTER